MFYAHFVLAKKGPLARIWLAAHWDKKLTKAHVFETNIEKSVDGILQPKVKMALRTTGHLLLGVVRIYSRKAKYLLADCNEAFVKIKMAFRPGMVDLPEEHREAAVTAITLPEVFHDFDSAMPELKDVDIEAQFSLNQSRAEEITMREDYGSLSLVTHDQGFGDMSFDAEPPDVMRHASSMEQHHMLFSEPEMEAAVEKEREPVPGTSGVQSMDIDAPIRDDGFGGSLGQDIISSGGLFEGGLFDEAPMEVPEDSSIAHHEPVARAHEDSDDEMGDHFGPAFSPMGGAPSSNGSRPATPLADGRESVASRRFTPAPTGIPEHPLDLMDDQPPGQEKTLLLRDEEESFALAPVDASVFRGLTKTKRKRKLIVDEVKNISGEEMKSQLSDTTDIVTTLDLAPPTKRLMHWKETGGVEKLFALPGKPIPARALFKNYQNHLTCKTQEEDAGRLAAEEGMSLEQMRDGAEPEPRFDTSSVVRRMTRKRKAPHDEQVVVPEAPVFEQAPPTPMAESYETEQMQASALSEQSLHQDVPQHSPAVADDEYDAPPAEIPQIEPSEVDSLLGATGGQSPEQQAHQDEQHADEMYEEFEDDQQTDETYEEFEERVLNKRAAHMYGIIKAKLDSKDRLTLSEMAYKNSRKQVAQKFYTLLVLKKFQVLELNQESSYAEIFVSRGPKFENPAL